MPPEVLIVCALIGLPGVYIAIQALRAPPAGVRLFGVEFFGTRFALLLLMLVVAIGAVGVALVLVAWMVYRADRVGRGLAYVTAGVITLTFLTADNQTSGLAAATVASLIGAAILAFSPNTQSFFTGHDAKHRDQPTEVVVARVLLSVMNFVLLYFAVVYLLLGATAGGKYNFFAVIEIGVAVAGFVGNSRLVMPDRQARVIVLAAAAAVIVCGLAIGRHDASLLARIPQQAS